MRTRQLQQTELQKIEFDNVLTRIGDLENRNRSIYSRGVIHAEVGVKAAIFGTGLRTTFVSGMTVQLSAPGVVLQRKNTDQALFGYEDAVNQVTFDASDSTNPRIDIIECRVRRRNARSDDEVLVITNPTTQTIGAETRFRDFEYYLDIRKKTGVAAALPVAPSPTAGGQAVYTGTVTLGATTDLSAEYLLQIAVGEDGEYVIIDLRGGTPNATTQAEILAAINTAFPGLATILSNNLILTTTEKLKIRQPFDATKDSFANVLGGTESPGYEVVVEADLEYFKISEVLIPQNTLAVIPANIRSLENKDTEWTALASTVRLLKTYSDHVTAPYLDHPLGSIFPEHFAPSTLALVSDKTTPFRGVPNTDNGNRTTYTKLYPVAGFPRLGTVMKQNIALVAANGNAQNISDFEQAFPRSRVDKKQDTDVSGNYSVLTALSEVSLDIIPFTPSNPASVYFSLAHQRIGIYIKSVGSGYANIRIDLHDNANNQLATVLIPIADVITVGANNWIYANLPATLTNAVAYHYHVYIVGLSSPVAPQIGKSALNVIAFRELYKPTAGKYGGVNWADVFIPLAIEQYPFDGQPLAPANGATVDNITAPGQGGSSLTNIDVMTVDFSNDVTWQNWSYYSYIGIDPATGRCSVPLLTGIGPFGGNPYSIKSSQNIACEFNIKEAFSQIDAKNLLLHDRPQSLDDVVAGVGYWQQRVFNFSYFADIPLTATTLVVVVPIRAGYMLEELVLLHTANFTLSAGTAVTLRIGTQAFPGPISNETRYVPDISVMSGAEVTPRYHVYDPTFFSFTQNAQNTVVLRMTVTGGLLSNLTAGEFSVLVKLSKLGGNI